jgi:sulfatase maturation enzyme AslB (radical SAM superfamily)
VLVDELQLPAAAWSRAPRQISIALTNACDLKCAHCYASKTRAALTFDQVSKWLLELDRHGCLGVGFGGGEPTLSDCFADLCRFGVRNTKLAISFTTHAHRLSECLADELRGSIHFIRVSMDGVGATYEAIRDRSFETLLLRLRTVRRLARFGINFVVNAKTIRDLDAAIAISAEADACEFLLLPERQTARSCGIDGATTEALRAWVERYRGVLPLVVSEDAAGGLPICDPIPGETGLRAYAHIDAAAVVKTRSYDASGSRIGNEGVVVALDRLRCSSTGETS